MAEVDSTGAVLTRYVYATRVNVPDYMIRGGVTYRFVLDQLGSVRLVVNTATGAVVQRLDYDEWGQVTQNTHPGWQPFGYAGGLTDPATPLVRFGARDYDPYAGRWTAKDPMDFGGGAANLYRYVVGDPINLVDATGMAPEDCDKLWRDIQATRQEIIERFAEQRANKNLLYETRRTGKNSWEGHDEQIRGLQARLRRLLDQWNNGPCNGTKDLGDARRWATAPTPERPAPRESPGRARSEIPSMAPPSLSPSEAFGVGSLGVIILMILFAPVAGI